MRYARRTAGMFLFATIAGCSTGGMKDIKVRIEPAANVRIPAEGTFSWWIRPGALSGSFKVDSGALDLRIRDTVEREMANRGFAVRPVGYKVDFLVYYQVVSDDQVDSATLARQYGQKTGGPEPTDGQKYTRGSLILDVLNPNTTKLMWRGVAEADIDTSKAPSENEKLNRINTAVRRILAKFPPR
jgi:hypothetical protein